MKLIKQLLVDFSDEKFAKYDLNVNHIMESLEEDSKNDRLFGECGTIYDAFYRTKVLSLHGASHIINNLKLEGKKFYGDVTFLETPKGKIAMEKYSNQIGCFKSRLFGVNMEIDCVVTWDYIINWY